MVEACYESSFFQFCSLKTDIRCVAYNVTKELNICAFVKVRYFKK